MNLTPADSNARRTPIICRGLMVLPEFFESSRGRGGLTKSGTGWPSGVGDSQQAAWQWRSLPSQVLPRMVDIEPGIGLGGRALRAKVTGNRNEAFRNAENHSKNLNKNKGRLAGGKAAINFGALEMLTCKASSHAP